MMFLRKILLLLCLHLLVGCSQDAEMCESPETVEENSCAHSKLLSIHQHKSEEGFTVSISEVDNTPEQTFILSDDSENFDHCDNFIQIPVKKAVVFSATHLFMIDTLSQSSAIHGFSDANYTANKEIQDGIKEGKIKELGDFASADIESIIMMKPDLVMISGFGDNSVKIEQLKKAGIPVIQNYEWKEETPLGRAEWIKLFGVLFNESNSAEQIFAGIEKNYTQVKQSVASLPEYTNGFLCGVPFKGIWHVPGGQSFMAKIFKDGNIKYPWKNNDQTGSLALDFESVTYQQKDNPLWLSCGYNTKASLLETDSRFESFEAFKNGRVYNYHKRSGHNGVIWYWEESVLRCDKLLSDFVEICHFKGDPNKLYFFKVLE